MRDLDGLSFHGRIHYFFGAYNSIYTVISGNFFEIENSKEGIDFHEQNPGKNGSVNISFESDEKDLESIKIISEDKRFYFPDLGK